MFFSQSDDRASSRFNNKKRVAHSTEINNYLITIPRCDLPKKYVFEGLVNFCNRLAVSKEKHSIQYLDSCCKNSSIRRTTASNSLNTTITSNSQNHSTSSIISQADQSQGILNNNQTKRSRNEELTEQQIRQIYNGDITNRNTIKHYKRTKTTGRSSQNEETVHSSLSSFASSQSSFLDETNSSVDDDNWIHCKTHIHIFAGKSFNKNDWILYN